MKVIEEREKYERARKRVACIKGFYSNLLAYLIVIPFLFWLNYRTSSFLWALIPAVGWGLGLIVNGMHAYGYSPFLGRNWEERKLKEFMSQDDF